jgi:hypothetical protein
LSFFIPFSLYGDVVEDENGDKTRRRVKVSEKEKEEDEMDGEKGESGESR